jgi:hypothetical protein
MLKESGMRKVGALAAPLILLLVTSLKPALAQNLTSMELRRDEKGSTGISFNSRCTTAHTYELTENPELNWLSIAGSRVKMLAPGAAVLLNFEFNSAGMEAGTYLGEVSATCLDCATGPPCNPTRIVFPVRLTVVPSREQLERMRGAYVEGQLLVSFESKLTGEVRKRLREFERKYRMKLLKTIKLTSSPQTLALFAVLDPADSLPLLVTRLEAEPGVSAQFNFIYTTLGTQERDYESRPESGLRQIRADLAQRHSTGRGIRVALVDTGVDDRHKDLRGGEILRKNFTDDKSHRRDVHGTILAGIIAAIPRNKFGISGVAPDVKLISIKAMKQKRDSHKGEGTTATVAQGVDFAIARKSHIINLSFGMEEPDSRLNDLVTEAIRRGVVVVAAAGNDGPRGRPMYPAALDGVIAVSAVDIDDSFYTDGTLGDYIDVAAPGVNVLSTMPDDSFDFTKGTSQAAAHVTGVVALLLEKRPNTSPKKIKDVLEKNSTDLGVRGRDNQFGSGLVDACRALEVLVGGGSLCR